eukprot:1929245-Rhodomonas_salina.1
MKLKSSQYPVPGYLVCSVSTRVKVGIPTRVPRHPGRNFYGKRRRVEGYTCFNERAGNRRCSQLPLLTLLQDGVRTLDHPDIVTDACIGILTPNNAFQPPQAFVESYASPTSPSRSCLWQALHPSHHLVERRRFYRFTRVPGYPGTRGTGVWNFHRKRVW